MFFGGLNGDGFFNEEYEREQEQEPYYSHDYSSVSSRYCKSKEKKDKKINKLGILLTDIYTNKAVLINDIKSGISFWVPKSWFFYDQLRIKGWARSWLKKQRKRQIKG